MIAKSGIAPYRLNLIRAMRERERRSEQRKRLAFILGAGCFGFFLLSVLYSALTIWQMEAVITRETEKLTRLQQEYRKYTATKLIIDKSDVEQLGQLQGKGVFWTRKLAAMAKHLPDNYWIARFSFRDEELKIGGYGNPGPQQNHLLILSGYINELKEDTSFADVFGEVRLKSAVREPGGKVAFELAAYTKKWRSP